MTTDRAYRRLKESIYRGRLRPGQRLVERDLAKRLGVSRIPLRESLIRLQSEGLVRSVPYSASFVEDLEPSDVLEIYSMRLLLEPLATRLAAMRGDANLCQRLRRLCAQMVRDTKAASMARLDRTDYRFHHAIVEGCGHKRLLRAYEGAHIRVIGPRLESAKLLVRPVDQDAQQHLKLVELIERREADAAEGLAREQVLHSLGAVEQAIGMKMEQLGMLRNQKGHL